MNNNAILSLYAKAGNGLKVAILAKNGAKVRLRKDGGLNSHDLAGWLTREMGMLEHGSEAIRMLGFYGVKVVEQVYDLKGLYTAEYKFGRYYQMLEDENFAERFALWIKRQGYDVHGVQYIEKVNA